MATLRFAGADTLKPKNLYRFLLLFSTTFLIGCSSNYQLNGAERWWIIKHPFAAIPARKITKEARELSRKMESDPRLDGDPDGGTVDAFRHSYWMARLSQQIKLKKALDLGKAHEKSNYRNFLKHKIVEEKSVQDSVATAMDLFNNSVGAFFGNNHRSLPKDSLINELILLSHSGQLKVILKDNKGRSLDCNGKLLDSTEYPGKWINNRCLVNSNESQRH